MREISPQLPGARVIRTPSALFRFPYRDVVNDRPRQGKRKRDVEVLFTSAGNNCPIVVVWASATQPGRILQLIAVTRRLCQGRIWNVEKGTYKWVSQSLTTCNTWVKVQLVAKLCHFFIEIMILPISTQNSTSSSAIAEKPRCTVD